MIRRCSRRSRRRSEDVIPAWRGDARRCAPHVHCTWPWCSRRCPRRCPRRRGVPAGSACGDESSNSGTAQRALRCKVSRSRRTCPASQLTCSRTDASPALGRRVAAWRCGGVAAWRCASRQRRVCAAEGELRVSCLRAATSERAYGVARMRRRQTAARLVAALWCSRMSWRGPLFGSRSSGCGGRAVDRVSLRVSLLCARSLEVSWEGRITVDTCTCVPAACALGREAVKYQLMGLTITRLPP